APLEPKVVGGKAVIVPWTNVDAVLDGSAPHAQFGDPILLDLGGDQIREIRKNTAGEYVILASTSDSSQATQEHLWAWNGDPDTQPLQLSTPLPPDIEPVTGGVKTPEWEGIGTLPDHLTAGSQVQLIMDQGDDGSPKPSDGHDVQQKDENELYLTKSRTDLVT